MKSFFCIFSFITKPLSGKDMRNFDVALHSSQRIRLRALEADITNIIFRVRPKISEDRNSEIDRLHHFTPIL